LSDHPSITITTTATRTTTKKDWSYIKEGEEVPTYPLDEETHSRRYNYFEGGVAEPEPHVTEGAATHPLTLHMLGLPVV
jgi:hypothetical protein